MDETPSADRLPPTLRPTTPRRRRRATPGPFPPTWRRTQPANTPRCPATRSSASWATAAWASSIGRGRLKANRLVALKMIRAVEHASPTDRLRFQIETEAVARLQHPHIVQLYEVGEVRGQPFFSLEFCDGGTLSEQLKKQRPSPRRSGRADRDAGAGHALRPSARGGASRPETGQRAAGRAGRARAEDHRLRPGQAHRRRGARCQPVGRHHGDGVVHGAGAGGRARSATRDRRPTCTRWAPCCTSA